MFIGRKDELEKLNKLYKTKKFQMPVIYGRRRIGKTALINEFVKDKKSISFTAIENSKEQNLENLSKCIYTYENGKVSERFPVYQSFQAAIEHIFELSLRQQLVFFIDEYPYVAKADKTISSVLQMLIDKYKNESKLYLILCGSSMSFMEQQVLGYESPLYGRRTAQLKISPFTFFETLEYFESYDRIDAAYLYGVSGGTPHYFLQFDKSLSVEENIKERLLDTSSYLFEEPQNLLKQEVREAALYNAIITAVANGSTKIAEIASKLGEETSACSACLKRLISLDLIRRETPFGEKQGKKSLYIIEDNLFRFWYRFIPQNISALQNGMTDIVYKSIEKQLNSYMGMIFEDICGQYLWIRNREGKLPIAFTDMGRWWGTNKASKSQEEIDIIASDGTDAIICECKWKNELTDLPVAKKLAERSKLLNYRNEYLYLFSKSDFTADCKSYAENCGICLVRFCDML